MRRWVSACRTRRAPEELNGDVHRFALIVLNFPKFSDGRAYSQARVLREHLGYQGELRATGQVLRDQLLYMHRAGFDAFEINRPDAEVVFKAAFAGNDCVLPADWR